MTTIWIDADTTKREIDKCAEPRETYDQTLLRVAEIYQSFLSIRQSVADHTENVAKFLKPFVNTENQQLLMAFKSVADELKEIQAILLHPPKPMSPKYKSPFRLKHFAEAILKRELKAEGEENE